MPNVDRVEVLASIQRRRRYSLDQKLAVLAEAAQPGMSISYIARRHGISPSLLFGWRRRMTEGGKEAVRVDDAVVGSAEVRALEKRIRELERVLGKKTLENEILREALKVAQEKKKTRSFAISSARSQLSPLSVHDLRDGHVRERARARATR